MNIKTILNKKIEDGVIRISEPTIIFVDDIQTIAEHVVTESEVCRVDLISLKYYRSPNFVDYILKYNRISNPFSILENDVILIPENDAVLVSPVSIKPIEASKDTLSIRDQFVNTKRLSRKDAKRVEYLALKAKQKSNGSKQILPPNILKEGDKNLTIKNGSIRISNPSITE